MNDKNQGPLDTIGENRLVPVVVLDSVDSAAPLAEALINGGLPIAEVTFRTAAAEESLRRISQIDGLLAGAGTVLTLEQAQQAIDAGAKFIVTPGTNPPVIEYCLKHNVPITPGIATPTDIDLATSFGLNALKFFPAEAIGGVKTLKAISGPYGSIRFIPTGGISASNLGDYLALPNVLACGGSWMVSRSLINEGEFDQIKRLVENAVALAKSIE